jgi:ATP synthase protein I
MSQDKDKRNADRRKLEDQVEKQTQRMKQAERDRGSLLRQPTYLAVLGLLFVLPVIGGAYLGRWIDGLLEGYSVRWTLSMIFLGVVVGAVNVYLFIRE